MPITREIIGSDPPFPVLWDTVWDTDPLSMTFGSADWKIAQGFLDDAGQLTGDDPLNRGGLQALDPIGTAILLCLFTDRRLPGEADPPDEAGSRRGWHGDTFDVNLQEGERALGSLLWTLERSALSRDTVRLARHYASESLQTLVDQGVVAVFDIAAEAGNQEGRLLLHVKALNAAGQSIFANTFPLF